MLISKYAASIRTASLVLIHSRLGSISQLTTDELIVIKVILDVNRTIRCLTFWLHLALNFALFLLFIHSNVQRIKFRSETRESPIWTILPT